MCIFVLYLVVAGIYGTCVIAYHLCTNKQKYLMGKFMDERREYKCVIWGAIGICLLMCIWGFVKLGLSVFVLGVTLYACKYNVNVNEIIKKLDDFFDE